MFRKGVYVLTKPMLLANNSVVEGEDPRNTVLVLAPSSTSTEIVIVKGVVNATIRGLTIKLRNDTPSTGIHIYKTSTSANPDNIIIENMHFIGGKPLLGGERAVYIANSSNITITGSTFRNVYRAILCYDSSDIRISENKIEGESTRTILLLDNTVNVDIENNIVNGASPTDSSIPLINLTDTYYVFFRDNDFRNLRGKFMSIKGLTSTGGSSHISFENNNVEVYCYQITCNYITLENAGFILFTDNYIKSVLASEYTRYVYVFEINSATSVTIKSNHVVTTGYTLYILSRALVNVSNSDILYIANNYVYGLQLLRAGNNCRNIAATNNMVYNSESDLYTWDSNNTSLLEPSDNDLNYLLHYYYGSIVLEGEKPTIATCVIGVNSDGSYWALTPQGRLITSSNLNMVYDRCRQIIINNGGGRVFFRAGTYTLTDTLYLADKMVLQGEGKDNTILQLNLSSSSTNIIEGDSVNLVEIADLTIALNGYTNGILINGSSSPSGYVNIHDVKIWGKIAGKNTGIYFNNVWNARIVDSSFVFEIRMPIHIVDSSDIRIRRNYIYGGTLRNKIVAINITGSNDIVFADNFVEGFISSEDDPRNATITVKFSKNVDIVNNNFRSIYNQLLSIIRSSMIHFDNNNVIMGCVAQSGSCTSIIRSESSSGLTVRDNMLRVRTDPNNPATFTWIGLIYSGSIIVESNDVNSSSNPFIYAYLTSNIVVNSNVIRTGNATPDDPVVWLDSTGKTSVMNNVMVVYGDAYMVYNGWCGAGASIVVSNNAFWVSSGDLYKPGGYYSCVLAPADNHVNYLGSS